ncbi:MAG: Sporulation related protein [Hydrocarboniphaga sp.]|uniref:SPOR domain-containing protein n=1 Tax=Hydrocarboniphaga sp. TaxID=2033016 RepID=UPI00260C2E02|nr:SPOR domain-containing protein [Hydrocarboniphaga sp.]MDB5971821.1 Sporulation related protein [Hydrocarboniphaga sp.]
MNRVLMRRLLGASVMLMMLFIASLLLPAPSDPKPAEPGMRRVEIAVDDRHPIETPKPVPSAVGLAADEGASASGRPQPPQASQKELADSAEAAAARFSGMTPETVTRPEVAGVPAEEDDDIAAAPVAETAAPEEPEPNPAPAVPPIGQRTPPAMVIAKPKPAPPVEQAPPKPAAAATPAPSPAGKGQRWAIQAGSYADIANARQIEAQLKSLGFAASISLTESSGSARYRVRSGPYATRDAADAARQRLQQNRIPANVVSDGG